MCGLGHAEHPSEHVGNKSCVLKFSDGFCQSASCRHNQHEAVGPALAGAGMSAGSLGGLQLGVPQAS